MARQNVNTENIEGRLYQKNLEVKTVKNQSSPNFGKSFIQGTIDVATDEACMNVIQIHYSYVAEFNKSGTENRTYKDLKRILESGKTVVDDGASAATKVRCTPSAALNDFFPKDATEVVSTPRHEGGFVSIVNELKPEGIDRNKFTFDALVTNVVHVDADPEKNINEDYAQIRCAIFAYGNKILPYTLVIRNPEGMKWFENLGATPSTPVYLNLWGQIINRSINTTVEVASAFGGPAVDTVVRRVREWEVTGAKPTPYDFGDPNVLTAEDVQNMLAERNIYLEEQKKRSQEYYNNNTSAVPTANAAPTTAVPGFFNL